MSASQDVLVTIALEPATSLPGSRQASPPNPFISVESSPNSSNSSSSSNESYWNRSNSNPASSASSSDTSNLEGIVICNGRFRIEGKIISGRFGTVFRGIQLPREDQKADKISAHVEVAVKCIPLPPERPICQAHTDTPLSCGNIDISCICPSLPPARTIEVFNPYREISIHQLVSSHRNVTSVLAVDSRTIVSGSQQYIFIVLELATEGDLYTAIYETEMFLPTYLREVPGSSSRETADQPDDLDELEKRMVGLKLTSGQSDAIVSPEQAGERVKKTFLQIIDGVAHCHSMHVFHRDLKPENILLFSDSTGTDPRSSDSGADIHTTGINGEDTLDEKNTENNPVQFDFVPKVADFGLASEAERSEHFRIGTRAYSSPECYGDPSTEYAPYDHRASDVWSLGILLYNMISARHPWLAPSVSDSQLSYSKSHTNSSSQASESIVNLPGDPHPHKHHSRGDRNFRAFIFNPWSMKPPGVTDEIYAVLIRALRVNVKRRCSLRQLREGVERVERVFLNPDEY